MNTFLLTSPNTPPRVARLTADGASVLAHRLGRDPTTIELLNVRRKAEVAAWNETQKAEQERVANCRVCSGIMCKMPEEKIANRFVTPADNWYMIAPKGEHPHPKGLVQVVDDEAVSTMVRNFKEEAKDPKFPGRLVDYDHVSQGGSTAAAGWITNLQDRPDGLWANIKWSDDGQKAVEGGRYRLVSPVWKRSDCVSVDGGESNRCRPIRLDSLGLTNEPNMEGLIPISK